MKVNFERIRRDIISTRKDLFLLEFPELQHEINEVAKKPYSNLVCKDFQNKLTNVSDIKEKLQSIYEREITELDLQYNFILKGYSQKSFTHRVNVDEYDQWFVDYTSAVGLRNIKSFSTFVDANKNEVVFSAIILER